MNDYDKKKASQRMDDIVYALWIVTSALESHAARMGSVLDRNDVRSAFNVLNDIEYTTNRPIWETKKL